MTESNLDGDIEAAFELQLRLLDEAHTRTLGPRVRRRIERKMTEIRVALEEIREEAKVVDISYARWKRRFDEIVGGESP